jgi:hypothetical protein
MATDDQTYGFSKDDAGELINLIGSGESLHSELKPRGGGQSLFGFRVNSGFSSGQTQAKIYRLAGASFGDLIGTFTLYDPTRWATGFLAGDIGLCQKSGGLYYAIQAPCPDVEASSSVSSNEVSSVQAPEPPLPPE